MKSEVQTVVAEPLLLWQDNAGVVTLRLNLLAQSSLLSQALMSELEAELDGIAADPGARVVVGDKGYADSSITLITQKAGVGQGAFSLYETLRDV